MANGSVIQRVAPGDAAIRISYGGLTYSVLFRVLADGPPWRMETYGGANFVVRDQDGKGVGGVLVEMTAGAMAGNRGVSGPTGVVEVGSFFVCGPGTVRASKAGYQTWTRSWVFCGNGGNGAWGSEGFSPVMIPITD